MNWRKKILLGFLIQSICVFLICFVLFTVYLSGPDGVNWGAAGAALILSLAVAVVFGLWISARMTASWQALTQWCTKMAEGDGGLASSAEKSFPECRQIISALQTVAAKSTEKADVLAGELAKVIHDSETLTADIRSVIGLTAQLEDAVRAIERIREQAVFLEETKATARETAGLVQNLKQGVEGQISGVNDTSYLVGQMAFSIQDVASSASSVSEVADKTRNAAGKGAEAVKLTVHGMTEIKEKVFRTAGKISELGEHSKQIGEIVQVISDIAEQTNLLALNAAIEAARAGEHGKGFAVVSDEVRKLAERSGKATKEISSLINTIQGLTEDAVKAMETGTAEVEKGSNLALDAGKALDEIMEAVEETYTQVRNISNTAEQLSTGSVQMVEGMESVAAATEESVGNAEQMLESSTRVAEAVETIAAGVQNSSGILEDLAGQAEQLATFLKNVEEILRRLEDSKNKAGGVLKKTKG